MYQSDNYLFAVLTAVVFPTPIHSDVLAACFVADSADLVKY